MDIKEIVSKVDHTLLSVTATENEIMELCDDGVNYGAASVCIAPCYVNYASNYLEGRLPVCTVIGFPNGYNDTKVKCFEAETAVKLGADEIDMVINLGAVKDRRFEDILFEINAVKRACDGRLLKVIVETCLLTNEEKVALCRVVSESEADYIKTSTGFSTGGATFEDVELFAREIKNGKKIKAAGGISSIEDAEKFIKIGASRLGTSRIIKILKNTSDNSSY